MLEGFDDKTNQLGIKGVGELGVCGTCAAVENAVFNATGIRVRDCPITLDKLLPRLSPVALVSAGENPCRSWVFTALDLIGPTTAWGLIPNTELQTVARTAGPVKVDIGLDYSHRQGEHAIASAPPGATSGARHGGRPVQSCEELLTSGSARHGRITSKRCVE
jgi:hypothetical protein